MEQSAAASEVRCRHYKCLNGASQLCVFIRDSPLKFSACAVTIVISDTGLFCYLLY